MTTLCCSQSNHRKAEVSVLTINGNKPDENGNIEITGGTGNVDEIDSITNEEIDQMFGGN